MNWFCPKCNRCFQAQVLKKITFSYMMRISRVGFMLIQIQQLELCSTTRKRNILKNYVTVFQLSWDGHTGNKRSSCLFLYSVEFPQCFDDLELVKLFEIIFWRKGWGEPYNFTLKLIFLLPIKKYNWQILKIESWGN